MSNIAAINDIVALTDSSLYCQPRVGLFVPYNNTNAGPTSNNYYYMALVDLPNSGNYPAPVNPPVIQDDGSLFYPYALADGSQLPDTPPAGVPLITYALPVWGGRPVATQNGDGNHVFPSLYFGKKDDKHKGDVIVINNPASPTMPYYDDYVCLPIVLKSSTYPTQYFVGNLVWLNNFDQGVGWGDASNGVQIIILQAQNPGPDSLSFQGFLPTMLQPSTQGQFSNVQIVFAPGNEPSSAGPATFSYNDADVTTL